MSVSLTFTTEYGFGVALLNDSKYGHAALGSTIRLSLLRSPKNPDPHADIGVHRVRYGLMPHSSTLQEAGAIDESAAFNTPPLLVQPGRSDAASRAVQLSYFSLPRCGVVLDAVKLAEDGSGDFIVRLYEAWGGTATFSLVSHFAVERAASCNVLEEADGHFVCAETKHSIGPLTVSPFKILSLRLRLVHNK